MGKISDLIKILKGEGNVAAVRRAERIGDEAPYAAERIDAETLRSVISRGDNANTLAIIKPEDFRYLARELHPDYLQLDRAPKMDAPAGMNPREYIRHLGGVAKEQGFRDIPFLEYGEYDLGPEIGVKGHEGRHRMRALEGLGDEKALVRLFPEGKVREPLPRRSRSEFLDALAEKYGVPLRLLPEDFKDRDPFDAEGNEIEEFTRTVQPFQAGGLAKFFSAVDEAVANLRQKKGTGEQMLKQIQQSPGVKKEELELRKLPEKLAGQQKVTQEDIQAMLKAVPAPKLELTVRSNAPQKLAPEDLEKWISKSASRRNAVKIMQQRGYEVVQNPEDPEVIGFMSPAGDILDKEDMSYIFETELEMAYEAVKDTKSRYDAMFEPSGEINGIPVRTLSEEANKDVITEARNDARDALAQYAQLQNQQAAFQEFVDDWEGGLEGVNPPKFSGYQTKGPSKNYRELLIRLGPEEKKVIERPPFEYGRQGLGGDPEELTPEEALRRLGLTEMDELGGGDNVESVLIYPTGMYITKANDGRYYTLANSDDIMTENLAEAEDWLSREMEPELRAPLYEPSTNVGRPFVQAAHFPEPDIVVHTRVSDRTGPNGEKILYVDEIQSDWHQKARGTVKEAAESVVQSGPIADEIIVEARRRMGLAEGDFLPFDDEQRFREVRKQVQKEKVAEQIKKMPKDFGYKAMGTRTPPWSQTSHELAVKQLLDTAANEGYDKVVFAPGSEQVRRYSLGEYFNRIEVVPQIEGKYKVRAEHKDGRKQLTESMSAKDLADAIGEDKAAKAIADIEGGQTTATFEGEELLLGNSKAQGKLKIYDEIIPQYLSKYAGKEFNVQPGRTAIPVEDIENARTAYEYKKQDQMYKDLFDKFQAGGVDEELDFEIREMLEDATRKQAQNAIFSPSFSAGEHKTPYEKFLERFDLRGSELTRAQKALRQGQFIEEIDPSSFGSGTGYMLDVIPEKFKFKDPAKQAKYEQFLEEQWLSTTLNPRMRDDIIEGRLRRKVEDEILRMDPKVLYADMPPVKTLEGVSIDITPEMREKIKTRGQPLFAVPPAVGAAAVLSDEEEPVQEYKEAGRVEKKKGMQQEQFDSPFDESRRMGPKPGVSAGPAKIRDLTKILRGENTEAKNLERQRIEGNLQAAGGLREYMYDMLVPQTGWEWAAEAAFFPVPRPVRKGLLAAAGAMYDPEAEAGKLSLLHGSPSKITNLQPGKDLWATTDPEYALKRAMDKMRIAEGARGPGMVNRFEIEDTDLMRLTDKYSPEDIALARRAFSKLPEGREMTGEEIYEIASTNTGGAKTAALEGVTRALGKKGYQVPAGAADKGDWYRVLDQTDLTPYGKGGKVIDAIKDAMKMTDAAPDPSRRKAIGLREKITQPGAMTTVEKEVSASDLDTLQKAMGNVGQAILNEPVSRREVLKRGALSAASNLIPGGGVLQQVVKEVTPTALKSGLPGKTDEEIAEAIAKYADDFIANDDAINAAYAFLVKQPGPHAFDDDWVESLSQFDSVYVLEELTKGAPETVVEAAKAVNLDIESVAKATGLSIEEVRRVMPNDADLLESVTENLARRTYLESILEDTRPKEAYRSTSLAEIDEEEIDGIIDSVVKEYGNDADDIDLIGEVSDRVRDRFFVRERQNAKKADSALYNTLSKHILDDEILDEVYSQGAYDDDYLELNSRVIQSR